MSKVGDEPGIIVPPLTKYMRISTNLKTMSRLVSSISQRRRTRNGGIAFSAIMMPMVSRLPIAIKIK